jgi:anti-anti-sigma factor
VASQETVRWTQRAGFAIAHLVGELDLATAGPTFTAIAQGRPTGDDLVIDLTEVEFMDSTALRHLVGFGPEEVVRVVAPDGTPPRRVLEITNLTSRFPTFETVDDAVATRG